MSKKLLSEAQVRRFQTLATISPLSEMAYNEETVDTLEEESPEMDIDAEEAPEMDADAEEAPEMDIDAEEAETDVEIDEELVEKFMDAVSTIQQVADSLGGAVDGEMDMAPEEAPEMDMAPEEAPEMDIETEEDEEAMLQEALRGVSYVPSQKEIVKQVAKRVAKRLQEAKNAQAKLNKALGKK
jgi:hypothetical protein